MSNPIYGSCVPQFLHCHNRTSLTGGLGVGTGPVSDSANEVVQLVERSPGTTQTECIGAHL